MKIANLKIGTRLGLGFGVVILLLLLVACIAVSRINLINDATNEILNDRYAKVSLAQDI